MTANARPPPRSASSGALRAFWRPTTAGASYLALLSLVALVGTLTDDRIHGVSAPGVRRLIATRFRGEVVDAALLSLATAVVLGLVLGALAGAFLALRDRLAGRPRRGAPELAWPALGVVAAVHAALWLLDLARHPQAYAPGLYASGGARALLQVAVCDGLGPRGVVLLGVVVATGFFVRPVWQAWRRAPRDLLPVAGGLGVLVALGVGAPRLGDALAPREARAAGSRPNVLLIAADSLRADRLDARVAPELVRLAARGTVFERAYVSLPRTFPSWVSILSGKDPHHHGIRHMFPRREARSVDVGALPRHFAAAGYHTAVVSDFAGDIFRRYDFGFAHTLTPTFDVRELVRETVLGGQSPLLPLLRARAARRVLPTLRELHDTTDPRALSADALAEIDAARGKPFFLVAFYSTTHFPYSAPAPHWSRYLDARYRGPYRYGKSPAIYREHVPGEDDVKAVRALYDGAVSATDEAVGELIAGLERRGLLDHTLVVVTADHGEGLYEPGRGQGHGDHLFGDEAVHVPLVVVDPRRPGGRRVPDVVRSVDLAPSLCELARVQCDGPVDGRSLVAALDGKPLEPRLAFAETGLWFTRSIPDVPPTLRLPYPDLTEVLEVSNDPGGDLVARADLEPLLITAKHRMVRDERFKLVYAPTRAGTRWFLFDTAQDPLETRDVAQEHPDVVARLSRELWRWMLEDPNMQRVGDMLVPRTEAGR